MVEEIFELHILIWIMAGLCIIGMLIKGIVNGIYRKLIRESDNMAKSEHVLMKMLKLKFETCYKLKLGVNNVDIFVDRYVYKYKFCGIHLYTWDNFGGQILVLCIITAIIGISLAIMYKCGQAAILSTFIGGLGFSLLLIVFDEIWNISAKRTAFRINVKDYLENQMKARMEAEYFYPDKRAEYQKEYFKEAEPVKEEFPGQPTEDGEDMRMLLESLTRKTEKGQEQDSDILNQKDEKIIAEILQEFLT